MKALTRHSRNQIVIVIIIVIVIDCPGKDYDYDYDYDYEQILTNIRLLQLVSPRRLFHRPVRSFVGTCADSW